MSLEHHHGLDIDNLNHLWLLHFLFLGMINEELIQFSEAWNHHKIQVRRCPNRSPMDYYVFDSIAFGVRGEEVGDTLDMENRQEVELYGVDWDALENAELLTTRERNNPPDEEGTSSFDDAIPERLNEVPVETPPTVLNEGEIELLGEVVAPWRQISGNLRGEDRDLQIVAMWTNALLFAKSLRDGAF